MTDDSPVLRISDLVQVVGDATYPEVEHYHGETLGEDYSDDQHRTLVDEAVREALGRCPEVDPATWTEADPVLPHLSPMGLARLVADATSSVLSTGCALL